MFIQVFQGRVRHPEPVYVELDQWIKEIARGTQGWLGSTAGVTDDNRFIGLARWESADAATRHTARPEQNHWWSAFAGLFVDPPSVRESSDTFVDTRGDPDQARFVQVIQGRGTNPARARELMDSHRDEWAAFRPDVLGNVGAMFDDRTFVMVGYFTTEEAAREGERKEPPPALKAEMDELNSMSEGVPEFFDLREPWIHSPA